MEERRLRAWAMRCADKINGATPVRAPHLGGLADFTREFPDFQGRTWDAAYRHVLALLPETER